MKSYKNIKFSIVIPVYNNSVELFKVLTSLSNQTLERKYFEVIVVDNNSSEDIQQVIDKFENIVLVEEKENLNSPYSSRNRGIEVATGEIIALVDATCIPVKTWLEEGKKCFEATNADLIGGGVSFRFKGSRPTAGEALDSMININMKASILKRNVAKTANLFVRREVFNRIGYFEEGIRSGGDVRWTKKATKKGFILKFCELARVDKEARGLFALIKKQFRVGKDQPKIWRETGDDKPVIRTILSLIKPISPSHISNLISSKGNKYMKSIIIRIWFVASLTKIANKLGNLIGQFKMISK